tara:strand:+ start:896 stop:1498 length:603 start_codon:yes stop_codon:yes gene_type:complete
MKNTLQNQESAVENNKLIDEVKNEVVQNSTQTIFDDLTRLENMTILTEIITDDIAMEFKHKTFMTENLELTDSQRESFLSFFRVVVEKAKSRYLNKIDEDERTAKVAKIVRYNLSAILEEMLSGLAQEVNRGALINCVAVAADTKNDRFNKIELQTYKSAGDITIPTRCLLVSTNCLDLIKDSVVVEGFDPETGEFSKQS